MARIARLLILSVVLLGFLLVPTTINKPAHGQTGCSTGSLSGPYGVEGSGFIGGAPAAFVGTFVFDGQGKLSYAAPFVLNIGGGIDRIDATGTYTVNPDCNGALVLNTEHHKPPVKHYHDMDMVVVDGGREALFTIGSPKGSASETPPPGEVISGVLKRQ
jgi:hypothetical protein